MLCQDLVHKHHNIDAYQPSIGDTMAQSVDPNKVIQKLTQRIANEIVQAVINEVAVESLEEANAAAAAQEVQPATPNEG